MYYSLGTKQQKDGFHIADNLKTCEKIPDPPLQQSKIMFDPPLQVLKKMIDPPHEVCNSSFSIGW